MLEGIEILSQEIIPITQENTSKIVIIMAIWLIIGIIVNMFDGCIGTTIMVMTGLLFVMPFCASDYCKTRIGERIEYKVTISDKVNFYEFNDRYEILNQEGRIYTIKEKEVGVIE